MIVSHFGVHWAPGKIAYLEQSEGGVDAFGLGEPSPFQVVPEKRFKCPHNLNLKTASPTKKDWEKFLEVNEDPLVRVLTPLPKNDSGGYFLRGEVSTELVAAVSRMQAQTKSAIGFPAFTHPSDLFRQLLSSNLVTRVIAAMTPLHNKLMMEIGSALPTLPGKLLICGSRDVVVPYPYVTITTQVTEDHLDLPWERIGAEVLRRYMRREDVYARLEA